MATIAEPRVKIIASTAFHASEVEEILETDPVASDAAALVEFAGRACYQSWHRPNPRTATAEGYADHILAVGHGSVLEHASVTFYITGISRSLTHELIRHRHLSFSELSQRFVNVARQPIVVPPALEGDGPGEELLHEAWDEALDDYTVLAEELELSLDPDLDGTARRKAAREAARAVLPSMCETRIVVSGNLRAWRDFILTRGSEHADAEIRRLAVMIADLLIDEAPEIFSDVVIDGGVVTAEYGRV